MECCLEKRTIYTGKVSITSLLKNDTNNTVSISSLDEYLEQIPSHKRKFRMINKEKVASVKSSSGKKKTKGNGEGKNGFKQMRTV